MLGRRPAGLSRAVLSSLELPAGARGRSLSHLRLCCHHSLRVIVLALPAPACFRCSTLLVEALGEEGADGVLAAAAAAARDADTRRVVAVMVRSAFAAAIADAEAQAAAGSRAAAAPPERVAAGAAAVPAARCSAVPALAADKRLAGEPASAVGVAFQPAMLPGGPLPPWLLDKKGGEGVKLQANPSIAKVAQRPPPSSAALAGGVTDIAAAAAAAAAAIERQAAAGGAAAAAEASVIAAEASEAAAAASMAATEAAPASPQAAAPEGAEELAEPAAAAGAAEPEAPPAGPTEAELEEQRKAERRRCVGRAGGGPQRACFDSRRGGLLLRRCCG